MIKSYKDMEIYKRSYEIALKIHYITLKFPEFERYEIGSQIRRATKSVPMNISEGYARKESVIEFKRFLKIGLSSCNEVQVQLLFCKDLKYITEKIYIELSKEYEEIGKMLNVTIQKWK